jgi:hypothetical protein
MIQFILDSAGLKSAGNIRWRPTLTFQDPNPPIPLEDVALSAVGNSSILIWNVASNKPVVQQITNAQWTGAFPFNFSTTANLTGASGALVFFTTAGTYAFTPTCTIGGNSASFVTSKSTASGGTLWCYYSSNFTAGASVSVSVADAGNFVDNGQCEIIGISGVSSSPGSAFVLSLCR